MPQQGLNRVELLGTLLESPNIQAVKSADFDLKVERQYRDARGRLIDEAIFFRCFAGRRMLDQVRELRRGDAVFVAGHMKPGLVEDMLSMVVTYLLPIADSSVPLAGQYGDELDTIQCEVPDYTETGYGMNAESEDKKGILGRLRL